MAIGLKQNGHNLRIMRDLVAEERFEAGEGADTVFARYRREPGRLFIDHVEAPPHLRGTGAAGALM